MRSLTPTILVALIHPWVAPSAVLAAAPDDACSSVRRQAEAKSQGAGVPYLTLDSRTEPGEFNRRADHLKIGVEMNLADFARSRRAVERAEADCLRFKAEFAAEGVAATGRLRVEQSGLEARQGALTEAIAEATANLEDRTRRLRAFHETRASVSTVAIEVASLKQDLIDTSARLDIVKRQVSYYPEGNTPPAEVIAELNRASSASLHATLADVTGPAWDVTVGAGWERMRYVAADEELYVPGKPVYGAVGIKWRPAVTFARDVAVEPIVRAGRYADALESWDVERRTLNDAFQAKLALSVERIEQVRDDLALVSDSQVASGRDYQLLLQREKRALGINIADWTARLNALGVRVAAASGKPAAAIPVRAPQVAKPIATFSDIREMTVTEGKADRNSAGAFATKGAKIRARAAGGKGATSVRANFTYVGPAVDAKPLASGAERRQLGVFMAAKNQCNLLYVMWRLPLSGSGIGEIVVQRKLNPGKDTHDGCGNRGYETVKPSEKTAPPAIANGEKHVLEAVLASDLLTVQVDGRQVWTGKVDVNGLDPTQGDIGWRSDNVIAEFALAKAGGAL